MVTAEDIVLLHILQRVPAICAVRFKCVSKGWQSFLSTPMFARMHLMHHQNTHKLLFKSNTRSSCTFCTVDCEAPQHGLTAPRTLPFKVDKPQNVSIITSFHGLVCVGINTNNNKNEFSHLILWNPLTGDYKTLSATDHKECYKTKTRASVLSYVSSEDDYKLLRVTNSCNVYIYSLKYDLWRKIEPTEDIHSLYCWFSNHSASLKQKLYFLKQDQTIISPRTRTYSIIRVDLNTEKFTEVATPLCRDSTCLGFTILRGRIHVWMHAHRHIELWRMDGDGDGDGDWTQVTTYYCHWATLTLRFQPVHLMADGNWLMVDKQILYKTYPEKPHNYLCTYTITRYRNPYNDMDIPPMGKYLETLVSPNQYMK